MRLKLSQTLLAKAMLCWLATPSAPTLASPEFELVKLIDRGAKISEEQLLVVPASTNGALKLGLTWFVEPITLYVELPRKSSIVPTSIPPIYNMVTSTVSIQLSGQKSLSTLPFELKKRRGLKKIVAKRPLSKSVVPPEGMMLISEFAVETGLANPEVAVARCLVDPESTPVGLYGRCAWEKSLEEGLLLWSRLATSLEREEEVVPGGTAYILANQYAELGRDEDATWALEQSFTRGHAAGQEALGVRKFFGIGTEVDVKRGFALVRDSLSHPSEGTVLVAAQAYADGLGVTQNSYMAFIYCSVGLVSGSWSKSQYDYKSCTENFATQLTPSLIDKATERALTLAKSVR